MLVFNVCMEIVRTGIPHAVNEGIDHSGGDYTIHQTVGTDQDPFDSLLSTLESSAIAQCSYRQQREVKHCLEVLYYEEPVNDKSKRFLGVRDPEIEDAEGILCRFTIICHQHPSVQDQLGCIHEGCHCGQAPNDSDKGRLLQTSVDDEDDDKAG